MEQRISPTGVGQASSLPVKRASLPEVPEAMKAIDIDARLETTATGRQDAGPTTDARLEAAATGRRRRLPYPAR
jgi:hypothetical protein